MSTFNYTSLPRTQVSNPRAAQILRRIAIEAIESHGFIVNIYPLETPNVDNLYNDKYEKGAVYGAVQQMKVGLDWQIEKDLVRYIATFNEKQLPIPLYVPHDINFNPGTKIEFPYNVIDTYSFTNTFKLVNRQVIGIPYLIYTVLMVVPQRF